MISEERKGELAELALERADDIMLGWWNECLGEWQDEEELSDEELEFASKIDFNIMINKLS